MSQRLPNLVWLRTFEAAARHLNFTSAAQELGLTQAAVSLHIRSLEQRLGAELFVREPRNLTLTEMGKAYLPAVSNAIEDLTLTTAGLFGPSQQKAVRVRAPVSTAILWLAPKLIDFTHHHPDIDVRMVSSIWADRMSSTDADVDLQLGLPDRFPGATEFLSQESIVPICHQDHAAHYAKAADLLHAPLIHILGFEDHWTRYFKAHGLDEQKARYVYSVDTTAAAIEMVSSGLGLAPVLTRFALQARESARSIHIVDHPVPLEQAHFLAINNTKGKARPEITEFCQWLRKAFAQDQTNLPHDFKTPKP